MKKDIQLRQRLSLAILCAVTFLVSYTSPVSYEFSDPYGSLLTSQAILEHGTTKLDAYDQNLIKSNQFIRLGEHVYYLFPIGTSLYATPFVWLANLLGKDMAVYADYHAVQNVLSALTTAISCALIFAICRLYLSFPYSLLLSSTLVFGSAIVSTMGTALWSINFAVVFTLLALFLLAMDHQKIREVNPYFLGFLLFSAYICRPTTSVFIAVILLYSLSRSPNSVRAEVELRCGRRHASRTARPNFRVLLSLWKRHRSFIKLAATCLVLFGVFALFSWVEYKQILPPYYLSDRLSGSSTFWVAAYGNLFSPARGILVYSPYLILTLLGSICFFRQLYSEPLFWVAASWLILHLTAISLFPHWWGGFGFGNRLMADAFPALALLTILVCKQAMKLRPSRLYRVVATLFIVLSAAGVFINTYQGLYNVNTIAWNAAPNIDQHPQYLFDWRYPQFLASPQMLEERNIEFQQTNQAP